MACPEPLAGVSLPGLVLLAGPTAVGKSEVALLLAERCRGEIISVDSMQVYRGLDIGTAKLSAAERGRVPHHLIDVVGWEETFDAARFAALAHQAVREIQSRGRVPILCGGTGLYFKAFLAGLGDAPPAEPALREALQRTPLSELLLELERADPAMFRMIDRNNPRRVVRAVEVIRKTGKPFSKQRAIWRADAAEEPNGPAPLFGLWRAPADLRERIGRRVEQMFERGLVEETKRAREHGLNRTARQAIGYRQVLEFLEGKRGLAETLELVKARTRQLAKRQMTWFRHQFRADWLKVEPDEPAALTVQHLLARLSVIPGASRP